MSGGQRPGQSPFGGIASLDGEPMPDFARATVRGCLAVPCRRVSAVERDSAAFGVSTRAVLRRRRMPEWSAFEDQSWRDRAACDGMDPGMFFDAGRAAEAAEVCASCPVRALCRDYAVATRVRWGVWAGIELHGETMLHAEARLSRAAARLAGGEVS